MTRSFVALLPLAAVHQFFAQAAEAASANTSHDGLAVGQQCKRSSYAHCCESGYPCDCSKSIVDQGQCEPDSYGFCCTMGTPCDCTKPPLEEHEADIIQISKTEAVIVNTSHAAAGVDQQCKETSYDHCCESGHPCDCSKSIVADGQCEPDSYGFCCTLGTPCDCKQPPHDQAKADVSVSFKAKALIANASHQGAGLGQQCKKASYDHCCNNGHPCDCSKSIVADGQCEPDSYAFCCNVGTPCDCAHPPVDNHKDDLVERLDALAANASMDKCDACREVADDLMKSGSGVLCGAACAALVTTSVAAWLAPACAGICSLIYGGACRGLADGKCAIEVCKMVHLCEDTRTAIVV
eukprot:TRINITY_DN34862_c0_g1_i1.p1 TRINITY_DN34862_c0_g1~~TRINITY_DN34862_c0_g1_i1.p1  ORF type:complete len:352 (+),score=46.16 TRINITY_DN34862_c0_g1_i1:73-1128(+)